MLLAVTEHCCCWGVTRAICCRRLRLDPNIFASLHAFLLVYPAIDCEEDLLIMGLLHYGVYTLTNSRRRRPGHGAGESAFDAVAQSIMEGAKGHPRAMRMLANR